MSVQCPSCNRRITFKKTPRPGSYPLNCPGCETSVRLVIPKDAAAQWTLERVEQQSRKTVVSNSLASESCQRTQVINVEAAAQPLSSADCSHDTGRFLVDTPRPWSGLSGSSSQSEPSSPRPASADSIPFPALQAERNPSPQPDPARLPTNLTGYRVEKLLGSGGMGRVYLARQLSLDRPVAIKVMNRRWSNDPVFLARFTREAFAAALLNNPNVVQIYDIAQSDGTHFFSMEYVAGQSLADLIRSRGKLDPEVAVGYILQAARGLKHAHDRGMIHRDVKPDNLLLDDQGIVKVADLGLVKTSDLPSSADQPIGGGENSTPSLHMMPADITGVRMALGTPAYMAPEQCRDATSVDHRADIYSLGCTLYALVTGRQPFDGKTAVELMSKHAYEPVVPPETIVTRLPKELSAVIQKMMAKDRDHRYQSMAEVIRTLEQWLGVHHSGGFSPGEDQIERLEQCVYSFNNVPSGQLRQHILTGFVSVCLLGAVLLSFFGQLNWAFGVAGMVLQTATAYFVINGIANRTYLFRRVRQFLLGLSPWDWGLLVAGSGLFLLLLWMLGLFWVWVGFGFIAVGLAIGVRLALDRSVEDERQEPLKQSERMVRRMRMLGVAEQDIRGFVAKYAGKHWEEFFEALFGYEAKLQARQQLLRGGSAGNRETYAIWREPLIALIDHIEKARQEARDHSLLQQVEQACLLAEGETVRAAEVRAAQAASALIQQARVLRAQQASGFQRAGGATRSPASEPFHFEEREPHGWLRLVLSLFVGPPIRASLAALLLAACTMWMLQNGFGLGIDWKGQAQQAVRAVEQQNITELREQALQIQPTSVSPLTIEGIPAGFTTWCDSLNIGWAGLLLLASLFKRGHRMSLLVLLGAVISVCGHRLGIRSVEPLQAQHVSLLLGTVIALVGFRMARCR